MNKKNLKLRKNEEQHVSLETIGEFLRWLLTFVAPNEEDLLRAGVYLDERRDRLMVNGEQLVYEELRRNNDEGSDLLFTK